MEISFIPVTDLVIRKRRQKKFNRGISEEAAKNVITIMEPENDEMWNKVIDELVKKIED